MRIGVLDIGSNSAQLLAVDVRPGAPPLPTHKAKVPTLLGAAVEPDGLLGEAAVDRLVRAVRTTLRAAHRFDVERLFAFATASVRDAANSAAVLGQIEAATGVRPECLTGEDEARLTYFAVHRWYGWSVGRLLVLDIGGGSMELALGRDAEPELAVSLPLGAGRLTREFLTADPPTGPQVHELRRHIRTTLHEVTDRLRWADRPDRAVATSKTFKQLARLTGAPPQRKGPFVPRTLHAGELAHSTRAMARMPSARRADLRGVSTGRAWQILAGALVAGATMTALDLATVDICPWALREGIMLHHLQTRMDSSLALPMQPLRPATSDRAEVRCEVRRVAAAVS
jgi:exopolyphosphatase / guanosine-5'-triphosphate,3'-diphosphate pyrophosphatase